MLSSLEKKKRNKDRKNSILTVTQQGNTKFSLKLSHLSDKSEYPQGKGLKVRVKSATNSDSQKLFSVKRTAVSSSSDLKRHELETRLEVENSRLLNRFATYGIIKKADCEKLYFITEHYNCGDLQEDTLDIYQLPIKKRIGAFIDLLGQVNTLLRAGRLLTDIKPANIMAHELMDKTITLKMIDLSTFNVGDLQQNRSKFVRTLNWLPHRFETSLNNAAIRNDVLLIKMLMPTPLDVYQSLLYNALLKIFPDVSLTLFQSDSSWENSVQKELKEQLELTVNKLTDNEFNLTRFLKFFKGSEVDSAYDKKLKQSLCGIFTQVSDTITLEDVLSKLINRKKVTKVIPKPISSGYRETIAKEQEAIEDLKKNFEEHHLYGQCESTKRSLFKRLELRKKYLASLLKSPKVSKEQSPLTKLFGEKRRRKPSNKVKDATVAAQPLKRVRECKA